jgi:hypothetical protein
MDTKKTVTFKEVHLDLEKEAVLIKRKDLQYSDFSIKGSFLNNCDFGNSIAAKLYNAIAESRDIVNKISDKYKYTFILKPQLERLCEKYNLFVRTPDFFMGDIPAHNVRDMMNFKVDLYDIYDMVNLQKYFHHATPGSREYDLGVMVMEKTFTSISGATCYISLDELSAIDKILGQRNVLIAAVEDLFSPAAFETSRARIISKQELAPKNEVDLDPIVLVETFNGYLVVTAWGDEANDELLN